MEAHQALDTLQPVDMYHPDFLGQIDFVAANLHKFAGMARSCGIDLPTKEVGNTLQRTKDEGSANAASFLGLLDPICSIGVFGTVNNFSFSGSGTCGISFFGINASECPVVVQNFGTNGDVQFSLKADTQDTILASGLTILGQPGHTCELTLIPTGLTSTTLAPIGPAQMSLTCTGPAGSCSATFSGFGGP